MKTYRWTLVVICFLVLAACGGSGPGASSSGTVQPPGSVSSSSGGMASDMQSPSESAESRGKVIYEQPLGGSRFACASCHALTEPSSDGFRRAGHQIADAPRRPYFKNTQLTNMVDAANTCLDEWMRTDLVWTNNSSDYMDLLAYLESQDAGTGNAEPLSFAIVAAPDTSTFNGDAMIGQVVFNQTCAYCHGQDAVLGDNPRGISIAGQHNADYIALRVRTSGNNSSEVYSGLTGGVMPFWADDRLSDDELADIIAFLQTTEVGQGDQNNGSGDNGDGGCAATHPKIGLRAQIATRQHGVSGEAVIVDDCTIEIRNFNFDGAGADVRVYTGNNGIYSTGELLIGPNLVRSEPYVNETISVTLPDNVSLDDFDGVSIWCVPFGLSFGDGLFN